MAGCPNYDPDVSGSHGLMSCAGPTEWRHLGVEIRGDRWWWLCPTCGGELRWDWWKPPADTPQFRPSGALESGSGYQEALWPVERETGAVSAELVAF